MRQDLGDGDVCPFPEDQQTTPHGRMYKMGGGGQWCAHSDHVPQPKGARIMAFTPKAGASPLDEDPKPKRARAKPAEKADKPPKAEKVGPLCKCGCGEHTKGGTFRPGHDAKYHSAQKAKANKAN